MRGCAASMRRWPMPNRAPRSCRHGFGREAERVKETADSAATSFSRVVEGLREAAESARVLIAETTSDSQRRSKDFVGEAMGQCDAALARGFIGCRAGGEGARDPRQGGGGCGTSHRQPARHRPAGSGACARSDAPGNQARAGVRGAGYEVNVEVYTCVTLGRFDD